MTSIKARLLKCCLFVFFLFFLLCLLLICCALTCLDFVWYLKQTTKRTGWVRKDVKNPESIADHMYRMSLMALVASDVPGVDRNKLIHLPFSSAVYMFINDFLLAMHLLTLGWEVGFLKLFFFLSGALKWLLFMTLQRVC